MYSSPQVTCVIGFDIQSSPTLAIFTPGSACAMPYAPDVGFSADASQFDSCSQSASKQENCSSPMRASANDRASSTLGVGAAVTAAFRVVEADPRAAPSERETVAARSFTVSSLALTMTLLTGLAVVRVSPSDVDVIKVSERGVAGAISMTTATIAVSAAVMTDEIEMSSRVPFLERVVGERAGCVHMNVIARY